MQHGFLFEQTGNLGPFFSLLSSLTQIIQSPSLSNDALVFTTFCCHIIEWTTIKLSLPANMSVDSHCTSYLCNSWPGHHAGPA